jgi:hypothetical protein
MAEVAEAKFKEENDETEVAECEMCSWFSGGVRNCCI